MKKNLHLIQKDCLLLVVDIQEKLCPAMDQKWLKSMISQLGLVSLYASLENIPVILTEQYPKGLGSTHPEVCKHLEATRYQRFEKLSFGCCGDNTVLKALQKHQKKTIILVGMESHICIYLTALGLIKNNFRVLVPHDAVISRHLENHQNGLQLMQAAGATIINAETLVFQMMGVSGGEHFKKISTYIKTQSH